MNTSSNIRYVLNKDIDRVKWDECISKSPNSLIYGRSAFLDLMVKGWDALILGDYKMIMPLPARAKWSLHYLYQPFLTPILGIFGNDISEATVGKFLKAIPGKYKLWDISLNHFNNVPEEFQQQYKRANYILPLADKSYEEISAGYSESIDRNITKAIRSGCTRRRNIPLEDIIAVCKKEWPAFTKVGDHSFDNIPAVYSAFPESVSYGVYHPGGRLLAACLFLIDGKRAYYWLVGNDPAAKEFGASPFLIDHFIKDHAGKDLILDFEGSDIEGIAEFYRRFGAKPEPYTTIYRNRLPFPASLLKKIPQYYQDLSAKAIE